MIGYSCNYTSREANGPMSWVKSDVLALFSEFRMIYNTRQGDFIHAKGGEKGYLWREMILIPPER